MPINLKPKYDVAIECSQDVVTVYLPSSSDPLIEADIRLFSYNNHGIYVEQEIAKSLLPDTDGLPSAKRLYVYFSPVWEAEDIADAIFDYLKNDRCLSVRYINH